MPDLFRGVLPLLILRTLTEGEQYGYEILTRLRSAPDAGFIVSEGSLYPALHRLEADRAVEASWRQSDRGPRRRYYRLTQKGRRLLQSYEREWVAVQTVLTPPLPEAR